MDIAAIGLNHHKTPIAIRERFALHKAQLEAGLQRLKKEGVAEVAILSTCNRTEIYCRTTDITPINRWLSAMGQLPEAKLSPHLFTAPSRLAVRHIYRVASGLDSMIIGEPNIFGQMKAAVKLAEDNHTMGGTLYRLFQSAFMVAKDIRSKTDIGKHGVSMATIALQLAENIFGDLSQTKILFIGTGEMIELSATHLCARRPKATMFVSRTLARAQRLVDRFGGEAGVMSDIETRLSDFDIVVACTEATLPIIGAGLAGRALKARQYRPMMMVDLGVPRNVEHEAAENSDLFLYAIDDLQDIINANMQERRAASEKAEWMVETRVDEFMRYLDHRRAVHVLQGLHHQMNDAIHIEMDKALRKLSRGDDHAEVLKTFSHRLSRQWIHPWMAELNRVEGKPFDDYLAMYQKVLSHWTQDKRGRKSTGEDDNRLLPSLKDNS